ncbi:N-acetyllactosaminide alpha-1,3-galactosyltransferase-like [Anarrhichthys ocellatus]|uniref:N-acetyllactosaminide alpha-1,3-galactosyltransferase-like n=1 Tax=Anarrhichthys ocellatus TaxID=433405 RepID=UPI0012EEDDEB|nr:N-acetyllactosaminide alpha-1,3-galactosyltransferase-like [Anarrhichthys ocellatus]
MFDLYLRYPFTHQPADTFTSCKSLFARKMKRNIFSVVSGLKARSGTICCFLLLVVSVTLFLSLMKIIVPADYLPVSNGKLLRQSINLDNTLNFGFHFLFLETSWKAPIIWEGMFDPNLFDQKHIQSQSSVALTVFAVGRYLDAYLGTFITSAEKHFMLGLQVTYYVFTDQADKVPIIELGPRRSLKVIQVEKHSRWQDISMMRMKTISEAIESEIRPHCNYVFCFDVDQEFKGRFGSEALGDSVALLHAGYFNVPKDRFTYDRNPKSKAYMETGDYYYHAAIFGGLCENVKDLADYCFLSIMEDKLNNVEALWHDESHLNKYFWLHKPSRLVSPEYCWNPGMNDERDIKVIRLIWAPKHYDTLRTR